jgi:hypothetical protein
MEGYLIQLMGGDGDYGDSIGLYWSRIPFDNEKIISSYKGFIKDDVLDEMEVTFEEWWNEDNDNKIERVFVDEIYV